MAERQAEEPSPDFNPNRPWAWVIKNSAYSPALSRPLTEYWYYKVVSPLSHNAGSVSHAVDAYEGLRAPGSANKDLPKAGGKVMKANPKAKSTDKQHALEAPAGKGPCRFFNTSQCHKGDKCFYSHVCSICGSQQHGALNCPQNPDKSSSSGKAGKRGGSGSSGAKGGKPKKVKMTQVGPFRG